MAPHGKNIVVVGFGSIGQGIVPLLRHHFLDRAIMVVEQSFGPHQAEALREFGLQSIEQRLTRENYLEILSPLIGAGDFLLNLAVAVSSRDLIQLAQARGAFYLDSSIEPWEYEHSQTGICTSNYGLREQMRAMRAGTRGKPTAIVAHGANPGFVSILVKQALIEMAARAKRDRPAAQSQEAWAALAHDLDVRVIQVSERDTQRGVVQRSPGEFVSTWSVDGFVTECLQPAELGWGTHEANLPHGGRRHTYGCQAAISIDRPGYTMKVRSWSPNHLDFEGFLITHNEAISIADYLTRRDGERVIYRPTCYYAYHPCDAAVESFALLRGGDDSHVTSKRILMDEIQTGIDELGVFLISGRYESLWLGSNLSIAKARKMAPRNNATSLQVASSIAAAMAWMLQHPAEGVVESEDLDHEFIYQFAHDYWSPLVRQFVDWRPRPAGTSLRLEDFLVEPAAGHDEPSLCRDVPPAGL